MTSSAKQVDIEQGTPEWHLWRGKLLTASDVAATFGESPYKTMRDLWFEKSGFGELEDEDRSWLFRKGHEVEAELRQLFSDHIKTPIQPACFEKGIFGCSLDGYEKSVGVFEAKFVGKEVLKKIAEGEIPRHHRIQIQTQLYGADAEKGFYGAKNGKDRVVVEFGRDEKLIKEIIKKGNAFWEMVQSGKCPELSAQDTMFITDKKQVEYFQRLAALKRKKDEIEAEYEELDKIVKSLASHSKVRCGEVLVTEVERAGSIDYLKIPEVKALAQEYLEKFRKRASVYKSIRFGKGA
jgi:putative phage-type endonuclease